METTPIALDPTKARELWREYRKHQHWSAPIDHEVMTTYKAIAQGKVVIKALESMRAAGLNADGMPKLAIARADATWCWLNGDQDGSAIFTTNERALWSWNRNRFALNERFAFPLGSFPFPKGRQAKAMVPQIPLPIRPKRALQNYHILFEAEWTPVPPVDPLLLRRVGKSDLWVVLAAWELTAVEQAALAGRMQS